MAPTSRSWRSDWPSVAHSSLAKQLHEPAEGIRRGVDDDVDTARLARLPVERARQRPDHHVRNRSLVEHPDDPAQERTLLAHRSVRRCATAAASSRPSRIRRSSRWTSSSVQSGCRWRMPASVTARESSLMRRAICRRVRPSRRRSASIWIRLAAAEVSRATVMPPLYSPALLQHG